MLPSGGSPPRRERSERRGFGSCPFHLMSAGPGWAVMPHATTMASPRRSAAMIRSVAAALVLLLLPPATAVLTDPAGDTAADHLGMARTPVSGWESMDLRSLTVEESPDVLRFTVGVEEVQQGP